MFDHPPLPSDECQNVRPDPISSLYKTGKKSPFLLPCILALIIFSNPLFAQNTIETRTEFSIEAGQYVTPTETEAAVPQTSKTTEAPPKVKAQAISDGEGGWTVLFEFPEPVTFTQELDRDDLYLEINQPVDATGFLAVQEKVAPLIKRFANGYHTFYLVAKRPVFYQVSADQQTLTINITPNEDADLEMTKQLKIAAARLLVENRDYAPAFQALLDLLEEYPNNKDVLVLYSSLEGLLPRWQHQVGILQTLNSEHPEDEDVETLIYQAYSPHSSYARALRQMQRTVGLAAVQVYLLEGEYALNCLQDSVLYAGAQYQLWSGHIASIVNSEGEDIGFRGWRNRGALYLRNEWSNGNLVKASLYDQKCAFGCGLEGSMLLESIQGHIAMDLEWHRPSWEVFEGLAYHGREDRFYMLMDSVYNRYFSWGIGGGTRRIGITGTPNGFLSRLANVNAILNFWVPNPVIGVTYNLDAEYVYSRQSKKGADGVNFYPVPYTSFENHTLRAFFTYIFREYWYFSAYAGETWNRIGLEACTYGFELKYAKPLPCGWEATISYNHFPSTIVSGATAEFLTATLIFRF